MSRLPDGTHYLAKDKPTPTGTPPLYRAVVENGRYLSQYQYVVTEDGWVPTTQITKMLMGLSDDEWVRVTPEVAAEIVAKGDARWAAEQADSGAGE